jgi:hypothetical protein
MRKIHSIFNFDPSAHFTHAQLRISQENSQKLNLSRFEKIKKRNQSNADRTVSLGTGQKKALTERSSDV